MIDTNRRMNASEMMTACGHIVCLNQPYFEQIELADIAFSLARINRFGGWWRKPISVLDHSIHVYHLTLDVETDLSIELRNEPEGRQWLSMFALLHDAHEAYLGDQTRPVEHAGTGNRHKLKQAFDEAIYDAAGLPAPIPPWIHQIIYRCDEWAASLEADRCLVHQRSGWTNQKWQPPKGAHEWRWQQTVHGPRDERDFFKIWMKVANEQGKRWAIRGLARMKRVCPDLYPILEGDEIDEMVKSGGF